MIGRELEGRRRRGAGRASPPGARGRPSPAAIGAKISLLRKRDRHAELARAGRDMEADGPFMRRRRSYPQVYSLTVTQACLD